MKRAITIVGAIVLFSASPLYAIYGVIDKGTWPESWPKELEGLRGQSRTLETRAVQRRHHQAVNWSRQSADRARPSHA